MVGILHFLPQSLIPVLDFMFFFVKFINGLQLQGTSQIKFVALFTGNRIVRLRKLIQIIITSINSLIAYHNLTVGDFIPSL